MESSQKERDAGLSARSMRGYRILFWICAPVFVLGFASAPFSLSGLRNLALVLLVWQVFYFPSAGKRPVTGKIPTIRYQAWVFIGICTLVLPLVAGFEQPFDWFVWGFVGFMGSAAVIMVATLFTSEK